MQIKSGYIFRVLKMSIKKNLPQCFWFFFVVVVLMYDLKLWIYQNQRYLSIQDLISYCIKEGISEIVFK